MIDQQLDMQDVFARAGFKNTAPYGLSRRVEAKSRTHLGRGDFVQPIDVRVDLVGNTEIPIVNMPDYPQRSVENCLSHISALQDVGIRRVMLRFVQSSLYQSGVEGCYRLLDAAVKALETIRNEHPSAEGLEIIVDPFGVGLNDDKTWGVVKDGTVDEIQTEMLFADIARQFASVGANQVLTLGRFTREVELAVSAIQESGYPTTVASFSTNLETFNAYVYMDNASPSIDTRQKILPGNVLEMYLWALADMALGTKLSVVKPAENLHILSGLSMFLGDGEACWKFLQRDDVQEILFKSPYLKLAIESHFKKADDVSELLGRAQLGAYTVSGTYFQDMDLVRRKGLPFLYGVLVERFCNIKQILSFNGKEVSIVDRNAYCFLKQSSADW